MSNLVRNPDKLDITDWLLAAYTASLPVEAIAAVPGFGGSLSRPIGLLLIVSAILSKITYPKVRKPTTGHVLLILFVGWASLSIIWSVDSDLSVSRVLTYVPILGVTLIMHDRLRGGRRLQLILLAFTVGCIVGIFDVLRQVPGSEGQGVEGTNRLGAANADVNEFGMTLAIGAAMALLLRTISTNRRVRLLCTFMMAMAPIVIFIAGSRGAILALLPPLIAVLISSGRRGGRYLAATLAMMTGLFVVAITIAPESNLERIEWLIDRGSQDHSVETRSSLAQTGRDIFYDNALLGVGSAAFPTEAARTLGYPIVAHSTPVSVAAELGIVGVALLFGGFVLAAQMAMRTARRELRVLWLAILGAWFVASATLTWEFTKVTWFTLGIVMTGVSIAQPSWVQRRAPARGPRPIPERYGSPVSTPP